MSVPCRPSLLLLLLLLLPAPAAAADPVWQEPLWLQPPGADARFPVLLTLPANWLLGDAAVLLLPDPQAPEALRLHAVEALLEAEAAVVEVDPPRAVAAIPGLPPVPPLHLADQPAALRAALRLLRERTGAGLLVALGLGAAGEAALQAAGEATGGAPALAGAAALGGPGPARFRAGPPPPAAEGWRLRAPILCGVLAGLEGGAAARRDCLAALLP